MVTFCAGTIQEYLRFVPYNGSPSHEPQSRSVEIIQSVHFTKDFSSVPSRSSCLSEDDNSGLRHCSQSKQIWSKRRSWSDSTIPCRYANIFICGHRKSFWQPLRRGRPFQVNIICYPIQFFNDGGVMDTFPLSSPAGRTWRYVLSVHPLYLTALIDEDVRSVGVGV